MGDCFKTLQDSNIIWAEKLGLRNVRLGCGKIGLTKSRALKFGLILN